MFTRKELMKLIIPLIIEQILAITVGMAAGMMVARAGEAAVSGVSLVDSINVLLIGLFGALATGGAVVSAQFLGQEKKESACIAGEQLIAAILALSLIVMAIALLFGRVTLTLLFGDVDADVMNNARIYFFYSSISFPFIAVYSACAALFRAMGNSKISMMVSLLMNIINITSNAILIFILNMGVAGAAVSTLVSRMVAAVVMFLLLMNRKQMIHIRDPRKFQINIGMIKKILSIGVPNGLENSAFQIGKIIVQRIVAGLGTSAITANAIAGSICGLGVLPGSAIGLALITVVGRCVGARDYPAVKRYTFRLMRFAYIAVAIFNLAIIFALPAIIKMYSISEQTGALATNLMIYHCILSTLIWPLSFALPNALRAANDVRFTMWISMISMWVWRIGFSYVLAITFGMGLLGIWVAMTIDWLFRSVFFVIRFLKGKYRNMSVI
jgi:putative MATE family efflux protein